MEGPRGGKFPFRLRMFPLRRSRFRPPAAVLVVAACLGFAGPRLLPAEPSAPPGNDRCPLGATPQQIVGRYGPVLKHNARVRHHQVLEGGTILDGDLHGRNGMIIRVVYHQNRAVLLEYTRTGGPLTASDINTLLAACADGSSWEMGKDSTDAVKLYHRFDGKAVAHWSTADESLLVAAEDDNAAGHLTDRLLP